MLILAISADTDEIQHYAAFHPGLYCLPKYLAVGVSSIQMVKKHSLNIYSIFKNILKIRLISSLN